MTNAGARSWSEHCVAEARARTAAQPTADKPGLLAQLSVLTSSPLEPGEVGQHAVKAKFHNETRPW